MLFPIVLLSQTNDSIKTIDTAKTIVPSVIADVPKPVGTIKTKVSAKTMDTTKTSKFEIGCSVSPGYGYRKLKADAESNDIKQIRDTLEVARFGYTAGINVKYRFNNKIGIETGILYSDKGEKTKRTSFEDVPSGQKVIYYTYKYHYHYLDIPLKVNYYFFTGKVKLYVTAGISTNIFINKKTTLLKGHDKTDWEKTNSKTTTGFNRFNFALLAGAGINYKISDKLNLKAEPMYSRSLTSIINAPVKEYLYSYGLSIGIYRKL